MNRAHDVDDGINRADFVKMDLVRRRSVNRSLDFTESRTQLLRACLASRAPPPARHDGLNPRERSDCVRLESDSTMRVMVMLAAAVLAADLELRRHDSCTLDTLGPDGLPIDGQASQRRPDVIDRNACIDQRADDHVAGRT